MNVHEIEQLVLDKVRPTQSLKGAIDRIVAVYPHITREDAAVFIMDMFDRGLLKYGREFEVLLGDALNVSRNQAA